MVNSETDNTENVPVRKSLLQRAASLITGQRQKDYGSPEKNFQRIADLWSIHIEKILLPGEKLSPRQVAEMMMLLKLARTIESPTEDSYIDAAGYAGIAGELAQNEQKIKADMEVKPLHTVFLSGGAPLYSSDGLETKK